MKEESVICKAPDSLEILAQKIECRLGELFSTEIDKWGAVAIELREPLSVLKEMVLAGGKRLRPAFAYWAYVGAGGNPESEEILMAGCTLELLHSFAMIHDDIMDASLTRRGLVSLHKRFEGRHEEIGWVGDSRRFGEGVAILLGNLAFVYADMMLSGLSREAQAIFTELRLEVNMGQYLDLVGAATGKTEMRIPEDRARQISLYKSGKYTVERPLHLGAALLGELAQFEAPLSRYGVPLGYAFQLRDDILGSFGDRLVTGKPVGEDFREGKPTLLASIAMERVSGSDYEFFKERFGSPDLDAEEIQRFQAILSRTGARQRVELLVSRLGAEAIAALPASGLNKEASQGLTELAEYVIRRDL